MRCWSLKSRELGGQEPGEAHVFLWRAQVSHRDVEPEVAPSSHSRASKGRSRREAGG